MADDPDRAEGMVTKYFPEKGYGFVTSVDVGDGTTDVFFHISEVMNRHRIEEDWRLEFSPEYDEAEDGWAATRIRVISTEKRDRSKGSTRKPWYRRDESKENAEASASHLGVKSTDAAGSGDSGEDKDHKYDQSDHV